MVVLSIEPRRVSVLLISIVLAVEEIPMSSIVAYCARQIGCSIFVLMSVGFFGDGLIDLM